MTVRYYEKCQPVCRCGKPTASVTFPDLVRPDGTPCDYVRCVDHELEWMREQIATFTYFESQLTMAALSTPSPRPPAPRSGT